MCCALMGPEARVSQLSTLSSCYASKAALISPPAETHLCGNRGISSSACLVHIRALSLSRDSWVPRDCLIPMRGQNYLTTDCSSWSHSLSSPKNAHTVAFSEQFFRQTCSMYTTEGNRNSEEVLTFAMVTLLHSLIFVFNKTVPLHRRAEPLSSEVFSSALCRVNLSWCRNTGIWTWWAQIINNLEGEVQFLN